MGDSPRRSGAPTRRSRRILAYFQQHRVAADDPQRAAVYDYFRGNLADMLQAAENAGAKTILSTVAVNLKDFPPLGSLHRADLTKPDLARWEAAYGEGVRAEQAGRHEEAVEHYRAAAELDDRFADLHFRLARCHLAAGRFDEARKHYVLACDLDAMPFRADSRVNEVIRQTAAGQSSARSNWSTPSVRWPPATGATTASRATPCSTNTST